MTLLPLHLPHRTRRLFVPPFPAYVRGPMVVTEGTVLHRIGGCPDGGTWTADTAVVLGRGVVWCSACWPGRRCQACRFPSGDDVLCQRCAADEHDRDRRMDDAA